MLRLKVSPHMREKSPKIANCCFVCLDFFEENSVICEGKRCNDKYLNYVSKNINFCECSSSCFCTINPRRYANVATDFRTHPLCSNMIAKVKFEVQFRNDNCSY